jgi:hypothetical protein
MAHANAEDRFFTEQFLYLFYSIAKILRVSRAVG